MAPIQGAVQGAVHGAVHGAIGAADQCLKLRHGHGGAEQVALPGVAVVAFQKLALRLGFHPSAITRRPRLVPSATTVRAMAASLGSVSTSRTKLWSILS